MEYRRIENLDINVSLLGFGCMRFPVTADGQIDEPEAEKMLDLAYKAGVNYFDTAVPYHDGASEPFVGKALNKYPRDSYYLATKLPPWEVNTLEDAKNIFAGQLAKMEKDYFDFYLLHALDMKSWQKFLDLGVVEYCEQLKAEGKIRYLGFSFHDEFPTFEKIIHYKPWDFCQIQLNYMDVDYQAGLKGYQIAESLGIPVVIMEPVKGGSLANLPESLMAPLQKLEPNRSTASWALRWLGDFSQVKVILSGMSSMEQVKDNIETFSPFTPLSEVENAAVTDLAKALAKRVNNGCTECRYCMPCPVGVDIPRNFRIWNTFGRYQNVASIRWEWETGLPAAAKGSSCIDCGACEKACPQHLPIRADLKKLQVELDAACKG